MEARPVNPIWQRIEPLMLARGHADLRTLCKASGAEYEAVRVIRRRSSAKLNAENARLLAAALGVTVGWLTTGDDTPEPAPDLDARLTRAFHRLPQSEQLALLLYLEARALASTDN